MLQLVEHDNFYEGTPCIVLNYDSFNLDLVDAKPELKVFNMKTFYTFIKNKSTSTVTTPVNRFLKSLSLEDQVEIASTIVMANAILKQQANLPQDVYDGILPSCEALLNDLEENIGLVDKLRAWIYEKVNLKLSEGGIPLPDMSQAGLRPQDRVDMTFYKDEVIEMTVLAMFSKIFSCLTGEFIYRHTALINAKYKETFAIRMFSGILKKKFSKIMEKLDYYCKKLVINKAKADIALHYNGYTPEGTARTVMDAVFVKKLVAVDLYDANGNIIKFIASCVKSCVESQSKNGSYAYNIKVFADPKESDTLYSNEETNSSRIEMESTSSKKPAVVQPMANFAAKWIVKRYLDSGEIDKQMFYEALDYYQDYPMLITPISPILIGNYFGPELAGAKSIYLVEPRNMAELATLMQCISVQQKSRYLVHALTMGMSANERIGDISDFTLLNSWKASVEYTELRKVVNPGYGETTWDQVLKNINQFLTSKPLIYHTAPSIFEGIRKANDLTRDEYPDKDGTLFEDRLDFMHEVIVMFKTLYLDRKPNYAEVA